jgi:hypothetical protein
MGCKKTTSDLPFRSELIAEAEKSIAPKKRERGGDPRRIFVALIDPPTPLDPLEAWESFLEMVEAMPDSHQKGFASRARRRNYRPEEGSAVTV